MQRAPLVLFLSMSLGTTAATAQDSGLAFLSVGVNAEALARGDAGVASERGAFATYWNPAGLVGAGSNDVAVSHHLWIADVRTYAAAARFSLSGKWGLGIFATATGAGDLEARTRPGKPDGIFEAQFVSAGVSIARELGPVRAGISVKYLSERIFVSSSDGYAFDFGVQASTLDGGLLLGATYTNLGRMQRLNAEATRLPRSLRLGAEVFPFRILIQDDGSPLLNTSIVVDISHSFVTDESQLHVGLAAEVLETVTARAGYLSNDVLRDFSAGIGLAIGPLTFDYALLPFEEGFGGPAHILSLSYAY